MAEKVFRNNKGQVALEPNRRVGPALVKDDMLVESVIIPLMCMYSMK